MSRRRTPRWTEQQPVYAPASECVMNKRGYANREDARTAIAFLRTHVRDENDPRVEDREYLCPHCWRYHLTGVPQTEQAAS